jgi:hypothetical protein
MYIVLPGKTLDTLPIGKIKTAELQLLYFYQGLIGFWSGGQNTTLLAFLGQILHEKHCTPPPNTARLFYYFL